MFKLCWKPSFHKAGSNYTVEGVKKQRPTLCFHVSCLTLSFLFFVVIFLSVFLVLVSVLCSQGRFPNQLLHVNFETWLVLLSCSWEYISPLVSNVLFPACLFIQWAWKWGIYTPPGKAGHMSISLGVIELPYYSRLWVYISWYGKCLPPYHPRAWDQISL